MIPLIVILLVLLYAVIGVGVAKVILIAGLRGKWPWSEHSYYSYEDYRRNHHEDPCGIPLGMAFGGIFWPAFGVGVLAYWLYRILMDMTAKRFVLFVWNNIWTTTFWKRAAIPFWGPVWLVKRFLTPRTYGPTKEGWERSHTEEIEV